VRKQDIQILAGTATVITVFAVFHRILLVVFTVCLLALGTALSAIFYDLQDLGLDRSSPSVKRGIELREEVGKLAVQNIGPRSIDEIVSVYFPPGTSIQDAITMLKAAHASIDGPKLFVNMRPQGRTTEWFGVRAIIFFGGIAGGPQADFVLESDRQQPTIVQHASGYIMSVYL
jgi:hypothetical protein